MNKNTKVIKQFEKNKNEEETIIDNKKTKNEEEEKVIRTSIFYIKEKDPLFKYCDNLTFMAKNLKNAATFHLRQCFIYHDREDVPEHIPSYLEEMNNYIDEYNEFTRNNFIKKKIEKLKELFNQRDKLRQENASQKELNDINDKIDKELKKKFCPQTKITKEYGCLFYGFLDYYFCYCLDREDNPYKLMKRQTSQQVLRNVEKDWKSFFKGIKSFSKNPSKFTGKPNIPNYKKKNGRCKVSLTNQQCKFKENDYMSLPGTKLRLKINFDHSNLKLKEVRIVPMGTKYKIELVWEVIKQKEKEVFPKETCIAIDLGVSNLATITNNIGMDPIIINGGPLKSINQFYNKKKAELQSKLPFYKKNDGTMAQLSWSKQLTLLTEKRNLKIANAMHIVSKYIVNYCKTYRIGTIIIGLNSNWKQKVNIDKQNNQNFVSIPFRQLINKITYKAEEIGIKVIEREESYTSQASFLDLDDIPTYKKENTVKYRFSGRRVRRGLYVSKNGISINADVNGSYNIMRKEFPHLFTIETIKNFSIKAKKINLL